MPKVETLSTHGARVLGPPGSHSLPVGRYFARYTVIVEEFTVPELLELLLFAFTYAVRVLLTVDGPIVTDLLQAQVLWFTDAEPW